MANNRDGYTNIFGQYITSATLLDGAIAELQTKVANNESELTDVNIGSELRNILESSMHGALQVCKEHNALGRNLFPEFATGQYLDDIAYPYGLTRKQGTQANGTVIFTISKPLSVDYVIYGGTLMLSKKTGYRYYLESDVVLEAGQTWTSGLAVAEGYGEEYNCVAGEISVFEIDQDIRRDIKVTNEFAFTNGNYIESDDEFRERIYEFLRGGRFGGWSYYEGICEDVSGVHDVSFVRPTTMNRLHPNSHLITNSNNETVVCNDCTAVCLVNFESNISNSTEVLREITERLTNQYNLVLGHEFHVQPSMKNNIYLKVSLYNNTGYTTTEDEVYDALNNLFYGGTVEGNSTIDYAGYNIGETIYKSQMIDAIENLPSVHHVENISLLKWHKDLSCISNLENWINENSIYGASSSNVFNYSNINDFPDFDDEDYQNHKGSLKIPCWNNISTVRYIAEDSGMTVESSTQSSAQALYELVVDDYYFYKIKGQGISGDNNENEHPPVVSESQYWQWGVRSFDSISLDDCSNIKLATLNSKAGSETPHQLFLKTLTMKE